MLVIALAGHPAGALTQAGSVLVSHDFNESAQGWHVAGDTGTVDPLYTAKGCDPGGCISGNDEAIGETWYFRAPASVLKQLPAAVNGSISFTLKQSGSQVSLVDDDVVIVGPAGRLSYRFQHAPGTEWTDFSVRLLESEGWTWNWNRRATQAQIDSVLASPTGLDIRGEYVTGQDEGSLDNFVLKGAVRASQGALQEAPARPAGWSVATHGEDGRPDYARLFGMDTVHELRIVIAPDRFRAMQDDLQSLVPSLPPGLRGPGAGGAGAPGGDVPPDRSFGFGFVGQPGQAGIEQFAKFAEGMMAACSQKAANESCSANGVEGRCMELGPGPRMCLPAAVGDLVAELGRGGAGMRPGGPGLAGPGGGPGLGGPLSMISRDPMYVPVTVQHDGRVWTHVGMRYKGNSSLAMAGFGGNGKIPFRLDFDRYDDEFPEIEGQRFYGFQKLTFSSNFSDDSQIRELFATEVFRDRGVPAPRAAFYRVFIDTGSGPEYWGLYTMIEDPADGAMLDAQFGGRGGNLYKPDGPGANWTQFSAEGFPKKTNERRADFTDVEGAIAALHAAPGPGRAEWRSALEARFDADLFLRWLAVNTAVQNWDSYGVFAHNYYLYGDPGQKGRLRWIPWDNNLALGASLGGIGAGMFGGDDILQTQKGSQWPLISRLLADEVYASRYREHLSRALEGLFAPEAAAARMRQLHTLIAGSVAGDRGERPGHTTVSSPAAFERSVDGPGGLREVVERRHAEIKKALGR